jgi:hypothetical protein
MFYISYMMIPPKTQSAIGVTLQGLADIGDDMHVFAQLLYFPYIRCEDPFTHFDVLTT